MKTSLKIDSTCKKGIKQLTALRNEEIIDDLSHLGRLYWTTLTPLYQESFLNSSRSPHREYHSIGNMRFQRCTGKKLPDRSGWYGLASEMRYKCCQLEEVKYS